MSNNVVKEKNP